MNMHPHTYMYDSGEKVNILGGASNGHSEKKVT